jgi:hypothetical protein
VVGQGVFSGRQKVYDNLCWTEKDFAAYVGHTACPRP